MNWFFKLGAAFMLAGVVLGAFGAHALKSRLSPESMQIYQTAVLYHFIHALGLFVVAWAFSVDPSPRIRLAGICLSVGILLFSGSLYALALSGIKVLGAITPLGGLLFIAGWGLLALGGK